MHVVPALFGPDGSVGGGERYALELARHMADLVPTSLLSFGAGCQRDTLGQLSIRMLDDPWYVRGQRHNPLAWRLLEELRAADVVHCHQHHVMASSIAALF